MTKKVLLKVVFVDGVKVPYHVPTSLEGSLSEDGIEQWMRTPNRLLKKQTPLELMKKGECGRRQVIEAARAYAEGSYV